MKLYTNSYTHTLFQSCAVVAQLAQLDIETVVYKSKDVEPEDFKKKRAHGAMPMLELPTGELLYESAAIMHYIADKSQQKSALLGRDAFEAAQIEQWFNVGMQKNFVPGYYIAYQSFGRMPYDGVVYNKAVADAKSAIKMIDSHLKGKTFFVGNRMTLADIANFVQLQFAFQFVIDQAQQKNAFPNVAAWFYRMSQQSAILNVFGNIKMCEKSLKPVDTKDAKVDFTPPAVGIEAATWGKAAPKKEPQDDDEMDDLFGDDDEEDEEAEKAKMARMKEIAKTAKSHGKVVVGKSLIIWEVKPWGEDTDLDEMAQLILGIDLEGLSWKTEYKKEPIAYGVFKVVIGATVVDDQVSTDEVQEMIEAFEDHVQSVDIVSFNKL